MNILETYSVDGMLDIGVLYFPGEKPNGGYIAIKGDGIKVEARLNKKELIDFRDKVNLLIDEIQDEVESG